MSPQWDTEARALGAAHEARLLSSKLQAAESRAAQAQTSYEALLGTPWKRLGGALHRARRRLGAAARRRRAGRWH